MEQSEVTFLKCIALVLSLHPASSNELQVQFQQVPACHFKSALVPDSVADMFHTFSCQLFKGVDNA